ncbi:MAG: WecB/TagA/CpsF family glycosyltransferase [Bacillota bacterium]|jgi:N-acetylglucosaminyldiphosphoundecaprenol N-acetyl-beta-D-mannosaminyltransferase
MVKILGARVDNVDMLQTLCLVQEYIDQFSKSEKNNYIVTLNAEIIYKAQEDAELLEIINKADLVTPDGTGVLWAARKLSEPLKERVTGIDLMVQICKQAHHTGWRLYLFGGMPGIADTAAANIKQRFPDINIVGSRNGYFSPAEEDSIIEDIADKKPDVLFVALGAPKQEKWINCHRDRLKAAVIIGVGGSFDVLSGNVKRAPLLWQKLHLEWLWRLLSDPRRIRRMMVLPKFMLLVRRAKKQREKNKEEIANKRGRLPS